MRRLVPALVGAIFLAAGLPKSQDPWSFASAVANFRLLPAEWVGMVAVLLPYLEAVVGFCLLAGWWRRGATAWALVCLVGFQAALGQALARGLDIECGCFGGSFSLPLLGQLLVDLGLTLLLLWATLGGRGGRAGRSGAAQEHQRQEQSQADPADPGSLTEGVGEVGEDHPVRAG